MVYLVDPQAVALPDGAMIVEMEADRATINTLKKVGLNLVVLPSEALQALLDGVIMELRARKHCALNVISGKKVKNA